MTEFVQSGVEQAEEPIGSLNEAEAELYDRQLRLWGFEAQQRMQRAKILFCGVRGLLAETAKNLVLAGMNVTLQDSAVLQTGDLSTLYFARSEEVGQKRAVVVQPRLQALNAYVKVDADLTPLDQLSEEYFAQFSAIVLSDCSEADAIRINNIAREHSIVFFWGNSYADEGWFISDFGKNFEYQSDPPKCTVSSTQFPSICSALKVPWNALIKRHFPISEVFLRSRIIYKFLEENSRLPEPRDELTVKQLSIRLLESNGLSGNFDPNSLNIRRDVCLPNWDQSLPVCSVIGGFLSQEVVKAVSKIGEPMRNVFVFSTEDFVGKAFASVPN